MNPWTERSTLRSAALHQDEGGHFVHSSFSERIASTQASELSAFGWPDQGRGSEACRKASVRALRAPLTFALLCALVVLLAFAPSAHAAPAIGLSERPVALPLLAVVVLVIGLVLGIPIGRLLQARKVARLRAYCRVCAILNGTEGIPSNDSGRARRVRAGAVPPAPYSYSSNHPELTLAEQRRRQQGTPMATRRRQG